MRHGHDAFAGRVAELVMAAFHTDFIPSGRGDLLDYGSAPHVHSIHIVAERAGYNRDINAVASRGLLCRIWVEP